MKYFEVREAEALIPGLEAAFADIGRLAAKAQAKRARLAALESRPADAAIVRSQMQFLVREITARLQGIAELGGVPKGLEPALVDFLSRIEGRDVFLCWKLGEKKITHYHGFEEGFANRKKLPEPKFGV